MEIKDILKKNIVPGKRYAIMGIGSELRSDDGVGMHFIDLLKKMTKRADVLLIGGSTAPENFTGVIKDYAPHKLFVVDAAHMGLLPGQTRAISQEDIGGVSFCTHMLPLGVVISYLKSEINVQVIFIGIQPESINQGFTISKEVRAAAKALADDFYQAFNKI